MATLTEISVITRKAIIWIVGVVILYLVLRFLVIAGINYYKATHPAKLPPPNVLFGKIPPPKFPKDAPSSTGLTFVLQNIEGRPPETTSAGKVYFMPKRLPSLLAPQKAKDFAAKLGFTSDPQILSATNYHFTDPQDKNRTFELDIVNGNFTLDYNYLNNQIIFNLAKTLNADNAVNDAKLFLQSNASADNASLNGPFKVTLLTFNTQKLDFMPVGSLSNSNAIRVDFFKKDLDGYKLLPPQFNKSYNFVLMSGSADQIKKFIKVAYIFWPIAYDNFGTYPLKSADQAWRELTSGEGIVANLGSNSTSGQIIIRNIYLAYYDSGIAENYMQPIFVFEGDNDFAAYVPAIDSQWLER